MPALITGFALVAVVLVVAGLTWGFVERAPLSFPIIPETPIINYTWPGEAASARVARRLNKMGFRATAFLGGYGAWKAHYPVEPFPATVGGTPHN